MHRLAEAELAATCHSYRTCLRVTERGPRGGRLGYGSARSVVLLFVP